MKRLKNRLFIEIVVIIIAAVVLFPQLVDLIRNIDEISKISLDWTGLAFLVFLLTFLLSAASYIFLSTKNLLIGHTLLVQLASGFTNRILPSGTGAIALNTLYLKKSGHATEEALVLSTTNNVLGFLAFVVVTLLLGAYDNDYAGLIFEKISYWQYIIAFALFITALAVFFRYKKLQKKMSDFKNKALFYIKNILSRPISAFMSLLANSGITLVHLACLTMCILSTGYVLPIEFIALVLLATIFSVSISPTPNGLGVSEAVMSSALTFYGLPPNQALIATLSYRLVSYWIPIIPGFVAYKVARFKNII